MAQLALGIAGSVIGGSFGGPLGAQIGWAVGAAIGGLLDPVKQEGPRLADLRLQKSSYGGMLPIIYAKHRTQGNVIWQTDLVEHKQKSGGKGGPEITNYTYTASFAIALCEGPMSHIRRVWANGRLMFDLDTGSDNTSGDFTFAFYPGDEDQLPDPTMQAELGADQVPGYRGTCYVVFTDFAVTDYGNAIPNLEFEVVQRGVDGCSLSLVDNVTGLVPVWQQTTGYRRAAFTRGGIVGGAFRITSVNFSESVDATSTAPSSTSLYDPESLAYIGDVAYEDSDIFPSKHTTTGSDMPGAPGFPADQSAEALGVYVMGDGTQVPLWRRPIAASNVVGTTGLDAPIYRAGTTALPDASAPSNFNGNHILDPGGDLLYMAGVPAGVEVRAATFSGNLRQLWVFTNDPENFPGDRNMHHWYKIVDGLVTADGTVDPAIGALDRPTDWWGSGATDSFGKVWSFDNGGRYAYTYATSIGSVIMYSIDDAGNFAIDDACGSVTIPMGAGAGTPEGSSISAYKTGFAAVIVRDALAIVTRIPEGVTDDVYLWEIVSDLSVSTPVRHRAGLTEDDIDVAELTDLVDGFLINQQGAVRTMIEALMPGYFFDAVEFDDRVNFRKRGRYTIATITDGELAAREAGNEAPAPLTLVRAQEADLPRVLNVDYIQRDADYQPGTQYAERQSARSDSKRSITVPVVLGDDKAKAVAASNLSEAWLERERASIFLPRKFAYLTPTDAIVVKDRTWRIKQVVETKPGIFQLDIVPSLAAIYIQPQKSAPSTGIDSGAGGPPLPKPATDLLLLDIPLVRSTDVEYGLYAAMAPAGDGPWAGASLQKSNDAGASYSEIAVALTPASMGTATTLLGDFTGYGNTVDHINRLTVVVGDDVELAGVTRLALLSGANDALVGADGRWERISFEYAELIDVNTYRLYNLLRGRSGTEWAMVTHAIGDAFVLLSTVINPPATFAEIGLPLKYKPVTFGKTLESTTAQDFTNEAEALRPFSPAHLGGGRDATGNLLLDWDRRTRIGGAWKDNVDVPLSEPVELYTVRIWTDATYIVEARAFDTPTQDTIYLASEQTTDFGSPQATLYVSVEQVGQYRNSPQTKAAL